MVFSFSLLILSAGCSEERIEDGRHWYYDLPILATEGLKPLEMGEVRWAFDPSEEWTDPNRMAAAIRGATSGWQKPLACGVDFVEVKPQDNPDILFRCEPYYPELRGENLVIETTVTEVSGKKQVVVKINPEWCLKPNRPFALHAFGHGLGFEEPGFGIHPYPAVMDRIAIQPWLKDYAYFEHMQDFEARELDSFRIWSLEQGAPGCGTDDPPWSWEDPSLWYTYSAPPRPEMLAHIRKLEANLQGK